MSFAQPFLLVGAGLTLGYWMFGIRGGALFGGVALACFLIYGLAARSSRRIASAAFLVVAAILLYLCSTLGWGGAEAPDGSRFKASPVGLSRVLTPDQPTSRTEDCGWYDVSGYPTPCAIADRDAFVELRVVYPLVIGAVILCVLGALLSFLRGPWSARAQRMSACAASTFAIAAPVLFAHTATEALVALRNLPFGVGGSLGAMQLSAAIVLSLTVCFSPAHPRAQPAAVVVTDGMDTHL
jgi:hypothetical protein